MIIIYLKMKIGLVKKYYNTSKPIGNFYKKPIFISTGPIMGPKMVASFNLAGSLSSKVPRDPFLLFHHALYVLYAVHICHPEDNNLFFYMIPLILERTGEYMVIIMLTSMHRLQSLLISMIPPFLSDCKL